MFVSPPGPREISTWTNQPVQRRSEFKIPIIIIENKQSQRAALDVMRMWASADCRPQTVGQICIVVVQGYGIKAGLVVMVVAEG